MKVHGAKLKAALIIAATQGVSSYSLAHESNISGDLDEMARKGVVELDEQQVCTLAKIVDVDPTFFTKPN